LYLKKIKYRFLLCLTYVISLLSYYFLGEYEAELTLAKAASSMKRSWRKKESLGGGVYSRPKHFFLPVSLRSAGGFSYCSCWLSLRSYVLLNRKQLNSQLQNAVAPFFTVQFQSGRV